MNGITGFRKAAGKCAAALPVLLSIGTMAPINANPVARQYAENGGYPSWTDRVKWEQTIDMSKYESGSSDFEKFERARDELAGKGGGVLYYPAGTYDFSSGPMDGPTGRGLMLKSGIVIRGQDPSGGSAREGTLSLPTKFVFGTRTRGGGTVPRDWNIIGLHADDSKKISQVHTVGIMHVEMNYAAVYFGPELDWGTTYATAESWKSSKVKIAWKDRKPDGTHPMDPFCGGGKTYAGAGAGRFVVGCILENSCITNDIIDEGFGTNGFGLYRFGARIAVYGKHVFVASNHIPPSDKNFIYSQTTSAGTKNVLFDYGYAIGIDINKNLLGLAGSNGKCPGYFEPDIIVRDNHVFSHGNKGYEAAGTWVIVRNNHNERIFCRTATPVYGLGSGWTLTLDGCTVAGGASDNMSRGFDLSGRALWIDGNTFNNTGSEPGNDGEGILCQRHGGTDLYSWAITRNVHTRGEGDPGYMGGYDVAFHGCLIAWNKTAGYVGSLNNKISGLWDCAFVNNDAGMGTQVSAAAGQPSDAITTASGIPAAPSSCTAKAEGDSCVTVRWTDNAGNEAGFRVDRSADGGAWTTIAYRPCRSLGTQENLQQWSDYGAPCGIELRYRVTAINENDQGGSVQSATVVIGAPAGNDALPATFHSLHTGHNEVRLVDLKGRSFEPLARPNGPGQLYLQKATGTDGNAGFMLIVNNSRTIMNRE